MATEYKSGSEKGMGGWVIGIIIIVALLLVAYFVFGRSSMAPAMTDQPVPAGADQGSNTPGYEQTLIPPSEINTTVTSTTTVNSTTTNP